MLVEEFFCYDPFFVHQLRLRSSDGLTIIHYWIKGVLGAAILFISPLSVLKEVIEGILSKNDTGTKPLSSMSASSENANFIHSSWKAFFVVSRSDTKFP